MWNEYSINHLKNNKSTGVSIMIAVFIAAMFLSLITTLFYNMWLDNIHQIVKKEGDWQAKISENLSAQDLELILNFPNVKDIKNQETEAGAENLIYFHNLRSIYEDMAKMQELIGLEASAIQYHDNLLSEYFIFAPDDERPPLLLAFYVFVMCLTCLALILIIRNAFLVSMQARLQQLGILQSIGATPGQIKSFLVQEALALSLIPILLGIGSGVALCWVLYRLAGAIVSTYGAQSTAFYYHLGLFLIAFFASLLTVLCSAWLPARRLSKLSPLQAIKGDEELIPGKEKKFRFVSRVFGIEGELARKSLYQRRKALRTATLSLTLSFLVFSMFLSFITLSSISTKYTYFERYKDTWDIMATVRNQSIGDLLHHSESLCAVADLKQVESLKVYQKATVYTLLPEDMLSEELQKLGGLSAVAGSAVALNDNKYKVHVPLVIMDDESFADYCAGIGVKLISPLQGMVTINRIWDSVNSNYRFKSYIPFIKEQDNLVLSLAQDEVGTAVVNVPVLAYTDKVPALREEYSNCTLVQVLPASTWQNLRDQVDFDVQETYINVRTTTDEDIEFVQAQLEQALSGKDYEIENRVDEELFNQKIFKGYILLIGGLCLLLAIIGLANVFANTLGFIYQRKREFARYISIGLTPRGMKKMFCVEALIIGGKPILITIPLTLLFAIFAASASYIPLGEFFAALPVIPLTVFTLIILGCVALAYYLGGRKVWRSNIIEILKNDMFV